MTEKDKKIREAILNGLIDCRDAPDLGWSNFGGIHIDDCIAWLEKQDKKSTDKWISVEDDLPCNHKQLLSNDSATNFVVAIVNFDIEIKFVIVRMYRNSNIWTWWTNGEVLYWFPIPKLPKE